MIYYFSGTGNSRHVAEVIADKTGDSAMSINSSSTETKGKDSLLGFVFPVYGWMPPKVFQAFCESLPAGVAKSRFVYVVMTCGDDAGKTLDVFRRTLRRKSIEIDSAYTVIMPDVYVCLPGFNVDDNELRRSKFQNAVPRIAKIADDINKRRKCIDIHEGAVPRTKTYVLGKLFWKFLVKDKFFNVDPDLCSNCGICAKACPVNNIDFSSKKPVWEGKCAGCLNCYHSCPVHAINFGKQTQEKGQYTFKKYANEMTDFEKDENTAIR